MNRSDSGNNWKVKHGDDTTQHERKQQHGGNKGYKSNRSSNTSSPGNRYRQQRDNRSSGESSGSGGGNRQYKQNMKQKVEQVQEATGNYYPDTEIINILKEYSVDDAIQLLTRKKKYVME